MKRSLLLTLIGTLALTIIGFATSDVASGLIASLRTSTHHEAAHAAREALKTGADLEHAFELVAEAIQPSVVSISSLRNQPPMGMVPFPGFPFGNEGGGDPNMGRNRMRPQGLGSGVIVDENGTIVTNNHVIAGSDEVRVHLANGKSHTAKVLGTDPKTDVAVIRIDAKDLLPAKLGDSSTAKVGQWVAAFGSPFGLERTMTSGIISAKGRDRVGIVDYEDFLQTDAAINQGNSGGPLVNLRGEVIGINTAIYSRGNGSAGIGFTIPVNLVRDVMQRLITDGHVVRGFLGVIIQELDSDLARELEADSKQGIIVAEVNAASPAEAAGLKAGDIILRLDGAEVTSVATFRNRIATISPGSEVKLLVLREKAEQELTAVVGRLPGERALSAATPATPDRLTETEIGLSVTDLTEDVRRQFGLGPEVSGAAIVAVRPNSLAAGAGISPGDVLLGVARSPVRSAKEAEELLRNAGTRSGLALRVKSGDTTRYLYLRAR